MILCSSVRDLAPWQCKVTCCKCAPLEGMVMGLAARAIFWVAVKELSLSHFLGETILLTILYPVLQGSRVRGIWYRARVHFREISAQLSKHRNH